MHSNALRESSPFVAPPPETPADAPAVQRLLVELSVLRVETIRGGLERVRRIWDFVDVAPLAAPTQVAMRDNGFLIGVGRDAARSAVQDLLESLPDKRSKVDRSLVSDERRVELLLADHEADRVVFYVEPNGRSSGQSFERGKPVLNIAYSLVPGRLDDLRLRLVPEIRQPPGPVQYVRVGVDWLQQPEYRGRVYEELAFEAVVPRNGFVMLGPTPDVHRLPLLARPYFVEAASGRGRESLLIISPILHWTGPAPVAARSDSGGAAP
ncbi:MAG: hypothetical protein L6Q92_13480 [Phycisphaerae bacterium]|nr:hypothetical protein [Phycisphaerae bacterium]